MGNTQRKKKKQRKQLNQLCTTLEQRYGLKVRNAIPDPPSQPPSEPSWVAAWPHQIESVYTALPPADPNYLP